MSDFVRSVVNEILARNQSSPPAKPSIASRQGGFEDAESDGSPVDLQGIWRPNYQKEKMKKRLAPFMERKDSAGRAGGAVVQANASSSQGTMSGSFVENTLASLQKLSLIPVHSGVGTFSPPAKADAAQLIGKTKDGSSVWFYPPLHESLSEYLGPRHRQSQALGIVASRRFSPGQLFLIDEVMKEVPHLAYNVETQKTDDYPFVFRISGSNPQEIIKVLKDIYVRLNRRAIQGIASYFTASPTRFLVQNLRLANQQAVAVLEGVGTFDVIGLLDRCLKQGSFAFRFRIEPDYLLLQGEQEVIKNMIALLKQEADRLFAD